MSRYHTISTKTTSSIINASRAYLVMLYYRLKLKLTRANKNIWFNSECMKKKVSPEYIKIETKCTSPAAVKSIITAKTNWLRDERKRWYTIRDSVGFYLYVTHKTLVAILHPTEFDTLDSWVRDEAEAEGRNKQQTQERKLQKLVQQQLSRNESAKNIENKNGFFGKVINLSTTTLTEAETNILEKGLKYSPRQVITKKDLEKLAIDTEVAISKTNSYKDTNLIRLQCNKFLREEKTVNKCPSTEEKEIRNLKGKIRKHNLVIQKADKGNSVVVLDRNEYVEKVYNFINTNGFTELDKDPTRKFNAEIRLTLSNSSNLLESSRIYSLKEMNPMPPKLTGYIKIHKDGNPIRPVISSVQSPAYKLSKELNAMIKEILPKKFTYTIKNSLELIEKIKDTPITNNVKLASFDVVNLFTNVPQDECKEIIYDIIEGSRLENNKKTEFKRLIRLVLDQSYCKFNNKFYKQDEGLPMGSPISPLVADIFMDFIENKIFNSGFNLLTNVMSWYRYVDDILCLWKGTTRQLEIFLNFMNNIHPKIKFTLEIETNNKINFLDLTIGKQNNKLNFKIYRKDTYTDITIPNSSNTYVKHKEAAFNSMVHRLITVPVNEKDFEEELRTIKTIARNNGYNENIINRILKRKEKMRAKKFATKLNIIENEKKWISLTYLGDVSERVGYKLKKLNLNIGYKNHVSLGGILCNSKDKTEIMDKNGIYKLICSTCKGTYIGQTGRRLEERVKEHSYKSTSSFYQHIKETGHKFEKDNVILLHTCNKGKRLDCLETLEINRAITSNVTCFNECTLLSNSPLLKPIR